MVGASRMRMPATARRAQLLDTAKALAGARGLHAVTIEAVARGAGVTRPIVYDHFGDLSGLLDAMLAREGTRALEQLTDAISAEAAASNLRDALRSALRSYLAAVRADPVTWRLVLMPPDGAPEILRERVEEGRVAVVAMLADVLRPHAGAEEAVDGPLLTARLLSAAADEAARVMLHDPKRYTVERVITQVDWLLDRLRN